MTGHRPHTPAPRTDRPTQSFIGQTRLETYLALTYDSGSLFLGDFSVSVTDKGTPGPGPRVGDLGDHLTDTYLRTK